MTDGKWTCSTNEEHWNCSEEFDTRDEALAYAISEFAPDYGLDDGDSFWIGQIAAVTIGEIAESILDSDGVLDQMACWLHDNVGPDFVDDIDVTNEQADDLEKRLHATVREWAAGHGIKPRCFTLNHIERHTWEQCKETRAVTPDASAEESPHIERCLRQIEHEGSCDWP